MRLDEYIDLVVQYSNGGINPDFTTPELEGIDGVELEDLYTRANESKDPEIKVFFAEMVSGGEFVTRYSLAYESHSGTRLDGKNICLNFSGESKELYCNTRGFFSVVGYDATEKMAIKPLGIKFTEPITLTSVKERTRDWFQINKGMDMLTAIEMVRSHTADTTLVEQLVPQIFDQVTLPESAMVIS